MYRYQLDAIFTQPPGWDHANRRPGSTANGSRATAGTPIVATDLEGIVTVWNGAAAATFGWEAQEVRGEPCPISAVADSHSWSVTLTDSEDAGARFEFR